MRIPNLDEISYFQQYNFDDVRELKVLPCIKIVLNAMDFRQCIRRYKSEKKIMALGFTCLWLTGSYFIMSKSCIPHVHWEINHQCSDLSYHHDKNEWNSNFWLLIYCGGIPRLYLLIYLLYVIDSDILSLTKNVKTASKSRHTVVPCGAWTF